MSKSIDEAYQILERAVSCGAGTQRDKWLRDIIDWLKVEYAAESLLSKAETIALAKKLICRGLRGEWKRSDVETFLKG